MNDFVVDPERSQTSFACEPPLFTWRGAEIVLFGIREADRFILARGWLQGDRLTDIRRWSFSDPVRFSGQVRRLVAETSVAPCEATAAGIGARAWTELDS
jgi:hypothetical protein